MFRSHRLAARFGILSCALWAFPVSGGCVQASQTYPLAVLPSALGGRGSVQVERIEGGQRLVVVQMTALPAPEQLDPALRVYAVWLHDAEGRTVKLGSLRYDRAQRSGDLLGRVEHVPTTWFTVRVTAERDADVSAPSSALLAERTVTNH